MRNKKAQTSGLTIIDLFLMLISFILAYFLVSILLFGGVGNKAKVGLDNIEEFKTEESAINNLRVQLYEEGKLEVDVNEKIKKSEVLGGKTITDCPDYFNENDCNKDTLKLYTTREDAWCSWVEEKCKKNTIQVGQNI
jgi:hypothetical protein